MKQNASQHDLENVAESVKAIYEVLDVAINESDGGTGAANGTPDDWAFYRWRETELFWLVGDDAGIVRKPNKKGPCSATRAIVEKVFKDTGEEGQVGVRHLMNEIIKYACQRDDMPRWKKARNEGENKTKDGELRDAVIGSEIVLQQVLRGADGKIGWQHYPAADGKTLQENPQY